MKKILSTVAIVTLLWGCKTNSAVTTSSQVTSKKEINVIIDLVNVKDDKVMVSVTVPTIKTNEITFHIPKTVPGTYSTDNYGKFIDDLKAFDKKGNLLIVKKTDDNSWSIADAKLLDKVTYYVNDTFDNEKGGNFGDNIFSPAGTNIDVDKNFMINTHGFVGYFTDLMTIPYRVSISHPATLWGATAMNDTDNSDIKDIFVSNRYADLVENPIMYSKPNYTTFNVNGMDILIAVYSPKGTIKADDITPNMKIMMTAQNNFLGKIKTTNKYCVLLYLSDMSKKDAQGFGALEHPSSTVVVFPEMMGKDMLSEQLKDVVSHEFFHIVTPLTIHSQEIQNFDYNDPKMSEHLWMYEGVTEYFANLFQVNQGLITEKEFYERMAGKIENASKMNDTMSFTTMSKNVLVNPYKDQYLNVYEKGALIGMCIDIQIRESSNGERGILDLMQKLSNEYGVSKAFNDDELFAKITELTYPEVGEFLKTYVAGNTPIPYEKYFGKVGVSKSTTQVPANVFMNGQLPYITAIPATKEIKIIPGIELSDFMNSLGLKGGDIITSINDKNYNLDNIYEMIMGSQDWKQDDAVTVNIKRDGKPQMLKGKVKLTYQNAEGLNATDASKTKLKEAWLKG